MSWDREGLFNEGGNDECEQTLKTVLTEELCILRIYERHVSSRHIY